VNLRKYEFYGNWFYEKLVRDDLFPSLEGLGVGFLLPLFLNA
jgi:hypothetical protein